MIKLLKIVEVLNEPIPRYLFHATFNALIPEIKIHGLIPHGKMFRNFEDIDWGVYLSNDIGFAGSMVQNTENTNIPEEWLNQIVICVIDTSFLDPNKLDRDPNVAPFEDEYDDTIPPDTTVYSYIYKGSIPSQSIKEIVNFEG